MISFLKKYPIIFTSFMLAYGISCTKSSSSTPPVTSDVNLSKGLLVYLPFDGNMADSSGNGNTTTPVAGAALTYDEHGNANSAFGGTGNGERIAVTNNGSIKFDTAFTFSVDVMVRNTVQGQAFGTFVERDNGTGVSFGFGMGIPNIPNLEIAVTDSLATCGGDVLPANSVTDTSQLILQPERWYNTIAVFHKGTLQIYVNGSLISTKTGGSSTVPLCPAAELVVGGWWDGGPLSINGVLDNVRLYNRVLNADEIAALAKDYQQD